jgi:glutathione-independent formaldehyde dehydrogenase
MLSDIFPTGFHGCVTAGVGPGSTVYVAGAGPVGLAAATSAQLLGAAVVIVGDLNADRLAHAATFGCETVDISKGDPEDQIQQILGVPKSTRRWMRWGSTPAATATRRRPNGRRRCSTR